MSDKQHHHQHDLRRAFVAGAKYFIDNIELQLSTGRGIEFPGQQQMEQAARQWVSRITGR